MANLPVLARNNIGHRLSRCTNLGGARVIGARTDSRDYHDIVIGLARRRFSILEAAPSWIPRHASSHSAEVLEE